MLNFTRRVTANTSQSRLLLASFFRPHVFLVAVLACIVSFTFAGCDSLEFEDPNAPRADVVSVQNLVTGTEGGMRDELDIYLQTVSIFGREAYFFEPADPRYTAELYTGPLDPNGFLIVDPWAGRYRTILNANQLLQRAEDIREATPNEFSESDLNAVRGFAKTIIGYQLLLALNSTWDNGIKIEFNDDVEVETASKEEGLSEIRRYLNEGFADLNGVAEFPFVLSPGFENGAEATVSFANPSGFRQFNRALLARVLAYRGEYGTEFDEALAASFIDENATLDRGVYHAFATGIGERVNPIFEVPSSPTVKLRSHPTFEADRESGDLRFDRKVVDRRDDPDLVASPAAANGLSSKIVVNRYKSSTAPIPMIRNEELLLLRAEGAIDEGRYDDAEDDINIIRQAAGLPDVTNLGPSNAMDQLLYERRYSLYLEGHRWIDARRFDRLDDLPNDEVGGENPVEGTIFRQVPIPQDELPEQ